MNYIQVIFSEVQQDEKFWFGMPQDWPWVVTSWTKFGHSAYETELPDHVLEHTIPSHTVVWIESSEEAVP